MREDGAAEGAEEDKGGIDAAVKEADEEKERPGEAFNPLLFRALQDVARTLEQPQVAGV